MALKSSILACVEDSVSDLLYYKRKEDDVLFPGVIEEEIKAGNITVDEIVEQFRKSLISGVAQ